MTQQPGAVPFPGLHTDEASLTWAAHDFGGLVHHRPLAVARPTTTGEISDLLRHAAAHHILVVPRGQGHSLAGQAQAPGGIVVDMRGLDQVHELTPDRIVVDAGMRWSQVVRAALTMGRTLPVLTDYIELSVGGTLSVGGFGGTSHRHGAQTDNVLALQVVLADGSVVECSPTQRPEVFDGVRANYGRAGIITRASLPLVPVPELVRYRKLQCANLSGYLAAQRALVRDGRVDHIEGHIKRRLSGATSFEIEVAAFSPAADEATAVPGVQREAAVQLGYWDFVNRVADGDLEVAGIGPGSPPNPWCNALLPDVAALEFLDAAAADLHQGRYGMFGLLLAYPVLAERLRTPHLTLPPGELVFLAAALRHLDADPGVAAAMLESNQRWFREVNAVGGTFYAHPFARG